MEELRKPLPIREANAYSHIEKPSLKVKTLPKHKLKGPMCQFGVQYFDSSSKRGSLIFASSSPSNTEETYEYFTYLIDRRAKPVCITETNTPNHIQFSSQIESGNLKEVYSEFDKEYNLYLRSDSNTQGHTQWFYFAVENCEILGPIRFNICNIRKQTPLFRKGMKPSFLSDKSKQGWQSIRTEVEFYRSAPKFYTLSFTFNFQNTNDRTYFAYALPYTYSRLMQFLYELPVKIDTLCVSEAGLAVPKLVITGPESKILPISKRKTVVLTGRVHPGETNGSYAMEGAIKFLMSDSAYAQWLKSHLVFHIIPMLNPDGVVLGNSRTSLAGVDLNRRWNSPDKYLHSSIFHCKNLIKSLSNCMLYCDFHAHSKKEGSFIYGCGHAANEGFTSWTKVRLFPRIVAGITPYFSFESCRFRVSPDRQGTGRVVVWKECALTNSFTLECSAFGYVKQGKPVAFNETSLKELGCFVMVGLYQYNLALKSVELELKINGGWLKPHTMKMLSGTPASSLVNPEIRQNKILDEINAKHNWRDFFEGEDLGSLYNFETDFASSGSDSCPSDDNLDLIFPQVETKEETKIKPRRRFKKRLNKNNNEPSSRKIIPALHMCWINHIDLDLQTKQNITPSFRTSRYIKKLGNISFQRSAKNVAFKSPITIRSYRTPKNERIHY